MPKKTPFWKRKKEAMEAQDAESASVREKLEQVHDDVLRLAVHHAKSHDAIADLHALMLKSASDKK